MVFYFLISLFHKLYSKSVVLDVFHSMNTWMRETSLNHSNTQPSSWSTYLVFLLCVYDYPMYFYFITNWLFPWTINFWKEGPCQFSTTLKTTVAKTVPARGWCSKNIYLYLLWCDSMPHCASDQRTCPEAAACWLARCTFSTLGHWRLASLSLSLSSYT